MSVLESAEQKWKKIIGESKKCGVINENFDPDTPPQWFDQAKFKRSQQMYTKYYTSNIISILTGFLVILQNLDVFIPIAFTGKSSNVAKLFLRYLSTINHFMVWTEDNPFDKNGNTYKSLKQVRGFHRKIAKDMIEKDFKVEGKDHLWVSQYSMVETQFAMIGLIAVFPKQCGLHSIPDQEFDCLLYFWRVIGYCLEIDDKYNLCSGTTEEVVQLSKLIYEREWFPLINSKDLPNPEGEEMAKGICFALNRVIQSIQYNIVMNYWYKSLNISKRIELKSIYEKLSYLLVELLMNYGLKLSVVRIVSNWICFLGIWLANKLKKYNYDTLKTQYEHISYDKPKGCPFNVNSG